MRGRDDHAASLLGGTHEVLPTGLAHELTHTRGRDARDLEYLQIIARLLDEDAARHVAVVTRASAAAMVGNVVRAPKNSTCTLSSSCARGPRSIMKPTISLRLSAASTRFADPSGCRMFTFLCSRFATRKSIRRWFSSSSATTVIGIS